MWEILHQVTLSTIRIISQTILCTLIKLTQRNRKWLMYETRCQGKNLTHVILKKITGNVRVNKDQGSSGRGNSDLSSYHKAFPKISNNFEKQSTQSKDISSKTRPQQATCNAQPSAHHSNKQEKNVALAPYTIVQILAAKLRQFMKLKKF